MDIPVHPGMEDIVKAVRRLRPFQRVQQRTAEHAVSLAPRGRVQQQTAEQVVHEPQSRQETVEVVQQHTAEQGVAQPEEETVEAVMSIPCERVQQQAVERMVDKSIPHIWEENPQEPMSGRICEQREVIEVTEMQADAGICSVQWSRPSWTLSRLSKFSFKSECLNGRVNRSRLLKYPRSQARKVSRQSRASLRSEFLNGWENRATISM